MSSRAKPLNIAAQILRKKFTVAQYHQMIESGILTDRDRVELLQFDRTVKVPLYAKDNIVEVWIVDLNAEVVQIYREPSEAGYLQLQTFRRGQAIAF